MSGSRLAFGPFVLDAGRLTRNGEAVAVGQRGLALLQALADARGATVTKADLLERAWPDVFVEEGNLAVQVAALRKLLGPAPDGGQWIATVARRGYRLALLDSPALAAAENTPERPAVAVLPFANIGGDVEQAYFADGVAADIITALSRFHSFVVVARGSSFAFKGGDGGALQATRDLDVRYVLEGSVRRAGDRLRISAQLVESGNGARLWAATYDGAAGELFDFQDRITEGVATAIGPHIQRAEIERSRRERPDSIAAYDVYLRALPKILAETEAENAEAHRILLEGLAVDANDGLLNAHAAWVLEHRITMGWPPFAADDRERCFTYARRALERAGRDPAVAVHCAMALIQVAREYEWGMAVLDGALEANPNNLTVVTACGIGHLHCGSVESALALFHRAQRLSPRDALAHIAFSGAAHVHMLLGDFDAALDSAARALAANPNFDPAYWILAAANARLGRMEAAAHAVAALHRIAPGTTIARIRAGQPARYPERLGTVLDGLRIAGLDLGGP
ncbi:MAG: transcriptional regulator [Rhizobiaceae bacterium]|nr:MAG: transcriptional regulator [Rhizobiaceae bacterium]CAG1014254.1 adenylate cyclase [Rhizobiaceae bacterium]